MENSEEAPAWLLKLENRREKLKHAKLGHEAGAGSPCNECNKCTGLDLHYWRKICRNCKCRKDQHICEDDSSGWAQFEILGQTSSKPAFISLRSLNKQNVKLEWVPPNVSADMVCDYMDFLGKNKIPIAGSNAAAKRKQQLEFQVPPHDLDASLCDNLSASETQQMQQYIKKIRDHCVGQGHVIRVGELKSGYIAHAIHNPSIVSNQIVPHSPSIGEMLNINENISLDDKSNLKGIRMEYVLSATTLRKLGDLDESQIESLVKYGPFFNRLISDFEMKNVVDDNQGLVGKTAKFLKEYHENEDFRKEINDFLQLKSEKTTNPQPLRGVAINLSDMLPQQEASVFELPRCHETPINENKLHENLYTCGLPYNVDYRLDPVFYKIINSPALTQAFKGYNPNFQSVVKALIISSSSSKPHVFNADNGETPFDLQTLQSAIINGTFYDQLFEALHKKNITVDQCQLLQSIKNIRNGILTNKKYCEELKTLLSLTPLNMNIYYGQTIKSNDNNIASPQIAESTNTIADLSDKLKTMRAHDPQSPNKNIAPSCSQHMRDSEIAGHPESVKHSTKVLTTNLNCQDCKAPICIGEVAVKAERAGKEITWHPQCFKCNMCRELLADLVYFFHGGQVFCGRDLAVKLKIPRCKACDELIFTKEFTAAENATFHIKHFCCFQCDMPLAGKQYIPDERTNMPICLQCYDKFYAASCQLCKVPIGPTDQGVSWCDLHWHGACFVCAGRNCGKSLIGQRFCVKESMPFCSPNCVHSIMN